MKIPQSAEPPEIPVLAVLIECFGCKSTLPQDEMGGQCYTCNQFMCAECARCKCDLIESAVQAVETISDHGGGIACAKATKYIMDDKMRFSWVNDVFEKYHGVSLNQVRGKNIVEVFGMDSEISKSAIESNERVFQTGKPVEFIRGVPAKGPGSVAYMLVRTVAIDVAGGRFILASGVEIDTPNSDIYMPAVSSMKTAPTSMESEN